MLQAEFKSVFGRVIVRLKAANGGTVTDGGGHFYKFNIPSFSRSQVWAFL